MTGHSRIPTAVSDLQPGEGRLPADAEPGPARGMWMLFIVAVVVGAALLAATVLAALVLTL